MYLNLFENSIILIHNHPAGITFSVEDLTMILKHKSIKYILAVGHNSEIFIVEKADSKIYEFSKEKWQAIIRTMKKVQNINLGRTQINMHKDIENSIEDSIRAITKYYNLFYYT